MPNTEVATFSFELSNSFASTLITLPESEEMEVLRRIYDYLFSKNM